VQDWWCPAGTSATNINNCFYDRAYAYPHAFNTYFSMYKIASLYPNLVTYHNPAATYLNRAYASSTSSTRATARPAPGAWASRRSRTS